MRTSGASAFKTSQVPLRFDRLQAQTSKQAVKEWHCLPTWHRIACCGHSTACSEARKIGVCAAPGFQTGWLLLLLLLLLLLPLLP